MTIRFTIDAENIHKFMDDLMLQLPQIFGELHANKKEGGTDMPWTIHDVTKEREILDECKKHDSCYECPKLEECKAGRKEKE